MCQLSLKLLFLMLGNVILPRKVRVNLTLLMSFYRSRTFSSKRDQNQKKIFILWFTSYWWKSIVQKANCITSSDFVSKISLSVTLKGAKKCHFRISSNFCIKKWFRIFFPNLSNKCILRTNVSNLVPKFIIEQGGANVYLNVQKSNSVEQKIRKHFTVISIKAAK